MDANNEQVKELRAKRVEELKAAMLEMFLRNNPDAPEGLKVELSPNAAIDLFGLGAFDKPEEEWQEFLQELRDGKPVVADDNDIPDDVREQMEADENWS